LKRSKIETAHREIPEFQSREASGKRRSHLENGQNFGNASKIRCQKVAMQNSKFELQKSGFAKAERFPEKYPGAGVSKVDIMTEKLGSKINLRLPENSGRFERNEDIRISLENQTF
jgi:hypothetical protein